MAAKRVLVVDDSASMRSALRKLISMDDELEVVGEAEDAFKARDAIKALHPDVITLDVEMPGMDGISFLSNLMRLRPMPVIMVSSLIGNNAEVTMKALELGVVDMIPKPTGGNTQQFGEQLREKLRVAASRTAAQLARGRIASQAPAPIAAGSSGVGVNRIIAIGASTGGTTAIKEVLRELPGDLPPIVISQHIPEKFSGPFAVSTDRMTEVSVSEAQDGQPLRRGHAYIAPGGHHLKIVKHGAEYICRIDDGERVNGHRPSVDVMFDSLIEVMGKRLVAVLLTGMGNDGAKGLRRIRDAGGYTVAQDEETSVVWGMPREAVKLEAACKVLPLPKVAGLIVGWSTRAAAHESKTKGRKASTAALAGDS
ncbi:MAG: chemotaxis response regulator protein-glutamate methylesterase [Pseudomonadota bacterium]